MAKLLEVTRFPKIYPEIFFCSFKKATTPKFNIAQSYHPKERIADSLPHDFSSSFLLFIFVWGGCILSGNPRGRLVFTKIRSDRRYLKLPESTTFVWIATNRQLRCGGVWFVVVVFFSFLEGKPVLFLKSWLKMEKN